MFHAQGTHLLSNVRSILLGGVSKWSAPRLQAPPPVHSSIEPRQPTSQASENHGPRSTETKPKTVLPTLPEETGTVPQAVEPDSIGFDWTHKTTLWDVNRPRKPVHPPGHYPSTVGFPSVSSPPPSRFLLDQLRPTPQSPGPNTHKLNPETKQ